MTISRQTIVSAPGKVLIAGGYLVLDRQYTGLTVGTSGRFYCSVQGDATVKSDTTLVTVCAGQFPLASSTWTYQVNSRPDGAASPKLEQSQQTIDAAGRNKFVETTVRMTLEFALQSFAISNKISNEEAGEELVRRLGPGITLTVLADNDFYSQRAQLSAAGLAPRLSSLQELTPFCPLPRPIGQTNKTGLGSSAALVTSLVSAILCHLGLADVESTAGRHIIHGLAQAAHCVAQGKVGSGFDVSSAVYGTHIYRRFSPKVLEPLFDGCTDPASHVLYHCVMDGAWDQSTEPFRLPRGLRLLLADVDAGTDTPSFVGKVLAWRKDKSEEALQMWTRLDKANRNLEAQLTALVALESDPGYNKALAAFASEKTVEDDATSSVRTTLEAIRTAILEIRAGMRDMSTASAVPIEPPAQSQLLDKCSTCPGVLGGGVPGAGGYDAIWILAIDHDQTISNIEEVWASWSDMTVTPLASKQSDGGLEVVIDATKVDGLQQALQRARR